MVSDITNQQLLDALTQQLGIIVDNMIVKEDVEEIVDAAIAKATKPLATKNDLKELKDEFHDDLDDLEVRLGRRIDDMRPSIKKRKLISAKP